MPTYEYKCPDCKKILELFHPITGTLDMICEDCEVVMTKGFGGGSAIHFKGSGFYETDYKNK